MDGTLVTCLPMSPRVAGSNPAHTAIYLTERGGSVVTHETRIREVPGSNPGADQSDWGFFVVFLSNQGLDFHYHYPFDHYSSNSYMFIIKLKSVNFNK